MAQGRYRIRPNGFMRLAATRRLVLLLVWSCVKQEEGLRVQWVYTEGEIPLGQCSGVQDHLSHCACVLLFLKSLAGITGGSSSCLDLPSVHPFHPIQTHCS